MVVLEVMATFWVQLSVVLVVFEPKPLELHSALKAKVLAKILIFLSRLSEVVPMVLVILFEVALIYLFKFLVVTEVFG